MDPRFSGIAGKIKARRFASTLFVLITLTLGILIGTVVSKSVKGKEDPSAGATPLQMPAPQQMSNTFSKVAKDIEPAVVNINTESTLRPQRRGRQAPGDEGEDPMQDFFDRFFGGQTPRGVNPEGMRQRSLGSGVILDAKGFIVTNAHVVERADRIRVRLMDDPPGAQPHEAKVIGTDRETDLAVIKIDVNRSLPAAKLGNSDSMNVGDWVLAIGSPFGLEQTVTAGIVSSKGRNIDNSRQFQSFIQTDAAINPGNSGGPLVNLNGEVIGINTAIFTQTNGSQGVGFAMPSKTVMSVYNQLIGPEHKVTRGSIGVQFGATPNPAVARMYGVPDGVVISSVRPGTPAEEAGLKTGDTIISVDGKTIKNGDELVSEISSRKPGTKIRMGIVRDQKRQELTVTVGDRAKLLAEDGEEDETADNATPVESKLGMSVRAVPRDMASQLGIAAGKGVAVSDVKLRSFAEDVGLQRGDIVLEINRQQVNNEEDLRRIQSKLKSGDDVVFLVRQRGRDTGTIFLGGTLP
ncbi:MAG TPA: Do family serine endopeptidase [Terriglobales bacterium]|nr:Do family serine endopeptidase [Terriglobales bacterium]